MTFEPTDPVEFHQVSLTPLLFSNSRVMLKNTPAGFDTQLRTRELMDKTDEMLLEIITKIWAKTETEIIIQRLDGFQAYFLDWLYKRLPLRLSIFLCKRFPIKKNFTRITVFATYPTLKIKGEGHTCNFHVRREVNPYDLLGDA